MSDLFKCRHCLWYHAAGEPCPRQAEQNHEGGDDVSERQPLAPQGSDEWLAARVGKITASRFKDVLTEPRGKADREAGVLSDTATSYLYEILGEQITGQAAPHYETAAMEWGHTWEPVARQVYTDITGRAVRETGFLQHPTIAGVGCSPDGLVGDDGGCEIKCPYTAKEHLRTVLGGEIPKQYLAQVQGAMWITGRDWWDFISYNPRFLSTADAFVCVRVARDSKYIEHLHHACERFLARIGVALSTMAAVNTRMSEAHTAAHTAATEAPVEVDFSGIPTEDERLHHEKVGF